MKKVLFLLFVAILFSCEKEQYCYKCDTKAGNFTSSIITCEMTPREARQFEIALRLQATTMSDTIAVVLCSKTECFAGRQYQK